MVKNIIIGILLLIIIIIGLFSITQEYSAPAKGDEPAPYVQAADTVRLSGEDATRKEVYKILLNDRIIRLASPDTGIVDCGTVLTDNQFDLISKVLGTCAPEEVPPDTTRVLSFPLFFHIFSSSQQRTDISTAQITNAIAGLNSKYAPARIRFTLGGRANITSDEYAAFDESEEVDVLRDYARRNFINIFIFASTMDNHGRQVNGYTRFISESDFIMLRAEAFSNNTTLPHEMGHYFWLYHTHGKGNSTTSDEFVTGFNCSCKGDDVCDTPADPNLLDLMGEGCNYIGTGTDSLGNPYHPDPFNLMSYAGICRRNFSRGQYSRMRWGALTKRGHFFRANSRD